MSSGGASADASRLDPSIPNVARVYDYMLGGKNNFAADRELAQQLMASFPQSAWIARQNRAFVGRAVRYCARLGICQFLDIGSGLPTMDNVHQVARRITSDATVVYVDSDRVALAHADALLATSPGVAAIWGDVRDPGEIIAQAASGVKIDFGRPMVVLLAAMLHFITDEEDPAGIVKAFREAMPAGSYLVLTHATHDILPAESEHARNLYSRASSPLLTRTRDEVAAFFQGLELVRPGLVFTTQWHPEEPVGGDPGQAGMYAGVGHKPVS